MKEKNSLMASLPLLSLFVCIFPCGAETHLVQNKESSPIYQLPSQRMSQYLICQNYNNSGIDDNSDVEQQKLQAKAARDTQINSLLDEAVSLYKQKQLSQAIDVFNQVLRLDPESAPAHFSLAIALQANQDLAGAVSHYEVASNLQPDNNEYKRAALSAKKKLDEQNTVKFEESKKQLLASQAADAFKQGNYDQAFSLYQDLEKQDPHLAFAKYNLGTLYLMQKKPDQALPYYKEAHKLEPNNKQYEESLEKLSLSMKQEEETKKQEKLAKQKAQKEASAKKNYIETCGMKVKSEKQGVFIKAIFTGSRAAQVGLRPGDIIEVIDGRTIKKESELEQMLESKPFGQRFQMLVLRGTMTGQILF